MPLCHFQQAIIVTSSRYELQIAGGAASKEIHVLIYYALTEFRETAYDSRKRAKGRPTSLDGVSVLNGEGRGPSTTRAAFYRSPPLFPPFSVVPPPFSRLYFLRLPARSTVTGLDADAIEDECAHKHTRERERKRFFFIIIAKIPNIGYQRYLRYANTSNAREYLETSNHARTFLIVGYRQNAKMLQCRKRSQR